MKILKTASGNKLKLSKKEWQGIGKKAGWMKTAQGTPWPPTLMTSYYEIMDKKNESEAMVYVTLGDNLGNEYTFDVVINYDAILAYAAGDSSVSPEESYEIDEVIKSAKINDKEYNTEVASYLMDQFFKSKKEELKEAMDEHFAPSPMTREDYMDLEGDRRYHQMKDDGLI